MAVEADADIKLEGKAIGNVGMTKASSAAAAVGSDLIVPPLRPEEKAKGLTDWNDLYVERGEFFAFEAMRKAYPRRPQQTQKLDQENKGPGFISRTMGRVKEGMGL